MKLIIISGRSGSGKSVALNVLEDVGYYCIDNLPVGLLPALMEQAQESGSQEYNHFAVSIDARNRATDFSMLEHILKSLPADITTDIIYLDANDSTLIKRFSETRRKHPLSNQSIALREAIEQEKILLEPIARSADLKISTNELSVHELRDVIKKRVIDEREHPGMAILFLSFGYKRGIPVDADIVFDLRCLPNPYWVPDLRAFTGQQQPVQEFLSGQPEVKKMQGDIQRYLDEWLPSFANTARSYMTIGIGCTGGYHRSVYVSEQLQAHYQGVYNNVSAHHRELTRSPKSSTQA
jgi:UPF0042 nucleotide-binding protein